MFRNLLSSRAILAGLVFFVLCVVGSLLYSWHVQRTTKTELAETYGELDTENRNQTHLAADTEDKQTVVTKSDTGGTFPLKQLALSDSHYAHP